MPFEALLEHDQCPVCMSVWCGDCVSKNPHLGKICKECGHNLGGKKGGIPKEVWDLPWSTMPKHHNKTEGL